MGCDIHIILEQWWEKEKKWVGESAPMEAEGRDYDVFAALAGVRGDGPAAKGLPDDASDLSLFKFAREGYHNHSWYSMKQYAKIRAKALSEGQKGSPSEDAVRDQMKLLGWPWLADPDNFRVVFCFDS